MEILRFHSGTQFTERAADAAFALVSDAARMPPLDSFAWGTAEFPDRSTLVIAEVPAIAGEGEGWNCQGPGIDGTRCLTTGPLPDDFVEQWTAMRGVFPRGLDMMFAAPNAVAGLPRTTRLARR